MCITEYDEEKTLKGRYREGFEEGREEGREEGFLIKGRSNIINALKARFQDVPDSIKTCINSIQDVVVLDALLIEAILCKSLEEFKQKL